jgi:protein ImuA
MNVSAIRPLAPARAATDPAPSAFFARAEGGAVHEIFARQGDAAAGLGFGLAAAAQMAAGKAMLWVFGEFSGRETGLPHGAGLFEYGLDPDRVLLARARDDAQILQAALEGARCAGLGVVLFETFGDPRALDLTASRRLALGCEASGVSALSLRIGGHAAPSAAHARWRVETAPSRALAAQAPGAPAFVVRLERHRGGEPERIWHMEWDRDARALRRRAAVDAALSWPVAALSLGGESSSPDASRRAG